MTERVIRTEDDRAAAVALMNAMHPPYTVKLTKGAPRSLGQNRLQWKWYQEAAEQLQEYTPDQYRAWCKLHIGVPILRGEDDEYREAYDRVIKPLPYEQKLALMGEPLAYPVTSMMSTRQLTQFLDQVHEHFIKLGVRLTEPDDPVPSPAAPAEGKDGPNQPVPQEAADAPENAEMTEGERIYHEVYAKLSSATTEAQVMERWDRNLPALKESCEPPTIKMLERQRDAMIEELRAKAS